MLKRDLTDEESLLRTFGYSEQSNKTETEDDKTVDLDIKKNFYYVIGPEGEIVDCAKIYSFLHEDNIYKRITARVCKHAD